MKRTFVMKCAGFAPPLALAILLSLVACMPPATTGDSSKTFVIAKAVAPLSLDPAVYATGNDYPIQELMYQQLLALDPSRDGGVAPELAKSWRVSEDGLSIEIELFAGRRFESGAPVDAVAVAFSLLRVKELGRWSSAYLEWLGDVQVLGPTRLRLVLERPYQPALQYLTQAATSIVDPTRVRANSPEGVGGTFLATHSAGSGPYRLEKVTLDGTVVLTPNPNHTPPRHFTRVEYRIIPDEGVRRLLLERGDVDFTDIVPSAFVSRYAALDDVEVKTGQGGTNLSFLTLNTRKGPFSNVHMRKAVLYAIDYEALRTKVLKGNAIRLPGYLVPGSPGHDPDERPVRRDLDKVAALLEKAGYRGQRLELITAQLGPVTEFLQSNLKEAGLNVEILRRDTGTFDAIKRNGDFDLFYDGWLVDTVDSASMLEALFHSDNISRALNASGYSDPETDALIDGLSTSRSLEDQARLAREIDHRLRTARPLVIIFSALPIAAYREDVTGIEVTSYKPYYQPIHQFIRVKPEERAE